MKPILGLLIIAFSLGLTYLFFVGIAFGLFWLLGAGGYPITFSPWIAGAILLIIKWVFFKK